MIVVAVVLVAYGLWDAYVLWRWGWGSGYTASWQTFQLAKQYPVIAFAAGYGLRWAVPGYELIFLAAFVAGHIFATMRGA